MWARTFLKSPHCSCIDQRSTRALSGVFWGWDKDSEALTWTYYLIGIRSDRRLQFNHGVPTGTRQPPITPELGQWTKTLWCLQLESTDVGNRTSHVVSDRMETLPNVLLSGGVIFGLSVLKWSECFHGRGGTKVPNISVTSSLPASVSDQSIIIFTGVSGSDRRHHLTRSSMGHLRSTALLQ